MRDPRPALFEATSELQANNDENRKQAQKNLVKTQLRLDNIVTKVAVVSPKLVVEYNPQLTTEEQVINRFRNK